MLMDYGTTKVIYVENISYVTLPNGTHIAVDSTGKLNVVPAIPAAEPLKPYPFTGSSFPTVAAETAIENAMKLFLAIQTREPVSEKGA
jgi:hypothetical protein